MQEAALDIDIIFLIKKEVLWELATIFIKKLHISCLAN